MCRGRTCCSDGRTYHCRGLARPGRRLHLPKQHLRGVISFPHTFTVLQFLHSCFSFCLLPAFPFFQCLYNMSPWCSSVCLVRHGLNKESQGYEGLWPAHLHKSHGPLLFTSELHLPFCPPHKDQIVHSHKQLNIFQSAWQAALMVPSHLDNCGNGFCVSLY